MDIVKQLAGQAGSEFIKQSASNRDYSRVPDWLRTIGDSVGYVGHTAANLAGDVGRAMGSGIGGIFGGGD